MEVCKERNGSHGDDHGESKLLKGGLYGGLYRELLDEGL